jgi:hypothetical protein
LDIDSADNGSPARTWRMNARLAVNAFWRLICGWTWPAGRLPRIGFNTAGFANDFDITIFAPCIYELFIGCHQDDLP